MRFRKAAVAVLMAAGAAVTAMAVPASPASASAGSSSASNGPIRPFRFADLCVTANSANAGATVQLNLCQAAASRLQDWNVRWDRTSSGAKSGQARICLGSDLRLCIGQGPEQHGAAPAELWRDDGTSRTRLAHALTLSRAADTGFRISANSMPGSRFVTLARAGASKPKPGADLGFRQPTKPDTPAWVLSRFHIIRR